MVNSTVRFSSSSIQNWRTLRSSAFSLSELAWALRANQLGPISWAKALAFPFWVLLLVLCPGSFVGLPPLVWDKSGADKPGARDFSPGSWTDGEGGVWDEEELWQVGGGTCIVGVSRTAASLWVLHGSRGVLFFQAVWKVLVQHFLHLNSIQACEPQTVLPEVVWQFPRQSRGPLGASKGLMMRSSVLRKMSGMGAPISHARMCCIRASPSSARYDTSVWKYVQWQAWSVH